MGRQYQVIAKHSEGSTLEPMGTRAQIADDLGTMNIHPQTPEGAVLYGGWQRRDNHPRVWPRGVSG